MKSEKVFFILAVIIFLFSALIFLTAFFQSKVLREFSYPASVNITTVSGFDVNSSAFTFGNLVMGSSSTREATFENNYEFPVKVYIIPEGNIEPLLEFDEVILVQPQESAKISLTAYASPGTEEGFYSGNIKFLVKKSK